MTQYLYVFMCPGGRGHAFYKASNFFHIGQYMYIKNDWNFVDMIVYMKRKLFPYDFPNTIFSRIICSAPYNEVALTYLFWSSERCANPRDIGPGVVAMLAHSPSLEPAGNNVFCELSTGEWWLMVLDHFWLLLECHTTFLKAERCP